MLNPQVYLDAADILERDGWGRGQYYDPVTGRRCAAGALMTIISGCLPSHGKYAFAAMTYIGCSNSILVWNDDSERTQEEVVALFRKLGSGEVDLNRYQ